MMSTTRVIAFIAAWLALAVIAGALGLLAKLRPPAPQLLLLVLTASLLVLGAKLSSFRAWVLAVNLRAVVALHLTRLVAGIAFLVLYWRGAMPGTFALAAGWGDILVGALALPVMMISPAGPAGRRIYLAWNVLGFVDILMVVVSAAVHGMRDPQSIAPLLRLPMGVLPTWLVPLIIASHVLLFVRLLTPPLQSSPFARTPL